MAGERVLHLTKDVVLPLGMVLALASFSYNFGGWKIEKDIKIAQALALAQASSEALAAGNLRMIRFEAKLDALEKAQDSIERDQRIFQSFAKGRIARLPWRAADAQ